MVRAYIGLGANLGDAAGTIESAILSLDGLGRVAARSALYRSAPWGVADQPSFINAVAALDTELAPNDLIAALKELERAFGRVPGERWGPRTLDLDVLTYGNLRIDDPGLQVPHPLLERRAFVLVPLAELDPAFAPQLAALSARERAEVAPMAEVKPSASCAHAVSGSPMDWNDLTRRVREVAAACAEGNLGRLRVVDEACEIEVRRGAVVPLGEELPPSPEVLLEAAPSTNGAAPRHPDPVTLRSDVVGIVRLAHPSVSEGSVLPESRELAYVESLGIRNPVSSGGAGRVVRVHVNDGDPVEYAQPLFDIERP